MTIEVPLTKGLRALIDDDDGPRVLAYKWCASQRGRHSQSDIVRFDAVARMDGPTVKMHRFILGARPGQLVDHRNGDTLDNRRENIRFCTPAQNQANHGPFRNRTNTAHYRGVNRHGKKWGARIVVNGKKRIIGQSFATPEDAARAWDLVAIEAWGEFARPNFPKGPQPGKP